MRRTSVLALTVLAAATALSPQLTADAHAPAAETVSETTTSTRPAKAPREVMFVGNNWDGTATVVNARTHTKIGKLNVVPDYDKRMAEIQADPAKLAYYLLIREAVGEGHDQYVDDMFSTLDGRLVAVSRPSFADVVGINLRTRRIAWRFPMHGNRADHMAVSPNGKRLLVSDSTANHVDELNLRTGKQLRQFPSGDTPHESNYSHDGSKIFHASIGRVYTPTDPSTFCPLTDPTKGDQRFQIVSNKSFKILKQWDIGQALKDAGFDCMASAVRPMAISPDEKTAYLQISFLHGYVVFDLVHGKVKKVVRLPDRTGDMPKSQYVLNSAHHGLAINPRGTKLCAAGTMDDYVGLIPIRHPANAKIRSLPREGARPYWATNGPDAKQCWVSIAGSDRVNVYSYKTMKKVDSVRVGDHPQRVRVGALARSIVRAWKDGSSGFLPPAL